MAIESEAILDWLNQCAVLFEKQQDYLTQLDADIGDADHGANMNRGFTQVARKISLCEKQSIDTIFKTTGMTLMSSVGGASGPLFGTFFICAASPIANKLTVDNADLYAMLKAGAEGVMARGKAVAGDKTMCDVLLPISHAAKQAVNNDLDTLSVLKILSESAEQGAHSTIEMRARKGRASYLGERSIGHLDPGATSCMLMVQELERVLQRHA